ncbi:unnamed protein product [Zymoseptoria tritici ST99CH_3D7]|uniref:Uncharacterized protein n=1 Tax=Zymoseptoria tritici (strain ST99CH_3D7) TaxID=1276538 RepID=A0A1X7RDY9_ZYMT9|nr:unnamed protein product [Zymoseptoria tritici ST99CH_3D7]
MALPKLPRGGFGKRKSLSDELNHIGTMGDEEQSRLIFETIETIEEDIDQAKTYRWHAPSTQRRQDHHKELYKVFYCTFLNKDMDADKMTEDEISTHLFPSDFKEMTTRMKAFLTYAFKKAKPRASDATSIVMRTFCQYRDSLLYWGNWYYRLREESFPRRMLFNELVFQMRYVQNKYGDVFKHADKTWLGLAELRQLLDYESYFNRCVELSEQHQILWCLGRVTALRPGSLCPTRYGRNDALIWRDWRFFVGKEPGMFTSSLKLDHLSIKRANDPMQIGEGDSSSSALTLEFPSPKVENIVFSPTHRILVMALRRGLLEGINTIDELLAYDKDEIHIKPQHLDEIMFYRGTPKGLALDRPHPLAADQLTEYLGRRGKQIGYTQRITWYSIRRRAATDLAANIGVDLTRMLLGHAPDSRTLELHYLNWAGYVNFAGILSGDSTEPTKADSRSMSSLATTKLDDKAKANIRGRALATMTTRLIMADPDQPEGEPGSPEMKNYRRRVRAYAEKFLIENEKESQRKNLTRQEMSDREKGLQASQFANQVLKQAMQAMPSFTEGAQPLRPTSDDDYDDEPGADAFVDDPLEVPEPDLEKALEDRDTLIVEEDEETGALTIDVDGEADVDSESKSNDTVTSVPYLEVARSAMELWLDNSLSQHTTWSQGEKRCGMCIEDDTAPQEKKDQQYGSRDKLEAHQESKYHHPVETWKRRYHADRPPGWKFECLYCKEADVDERFSTFKMNDLITHIMESTADTEGELHDQLKAADGWYTPEFENATVTGPSQRTIEKREAEGRKKMQQMDIDLTPRRQLLGTEPVEGNRSVVRGSHPPSPLPARYDIDRDEYNQEALANLPTHLQDQIMTGYSEQLMANPVPEYLRDEIMVTAYPRSAEEEEGGG